jgi:hypothetical protein
MTMLRDNPEQKPGGEPEFRNEPLNFPGNPLEAIEKLEQEYNEGRQFPRALREYLFLAGDFSYAHCGLLGSIIEENEFERERLKRAGKTIERPFFVFEASDSDSLFFYLDETAEDPQIYVLKIEIDNYDSANRNHIYLMKIKKHDMTLTQLIEHRIKNILEKRRMGWTF